jgi:hypothetical protein
MSDSAWSYHGITWDHPRGYSALSEASRRLEKKGSLVSVHWEKQSLEEFESIALGEPPTSLDPAIVTSESTGRRALKLRCKRRLQPLPLCFEGSSLCIRGGAKNAAMRTARARLRLMTELISRMSKFELDLNPIQKT